MSGTTITANGLTVNQPTRVLWACRTDRRHLIWLARGDGIEPKPYPSEVRDIVVRVARKSESGVTTEQIAKDFGVHPITLQKWLQRAAVDDGARPGQTRAERAELHEARKRIRLLEQENEVLRRAAAYLSQVNLQGKGSIRS